MHIILYYLTSQKITEMLEALDIILLQKQKKHETQAIKQARKSFAKYGGIMV